MSQGAEPGCRPPVAADAHQGVELRHLRYLVAVADAGTFTQAAERMLVTQPTLSQQIRRLEEMVGTPLLDRRRDWRPADRRGPCAGGGVADRAVPDRARGTPQPPGGRRGSGA